MLNFSPLGNMFVPSMLSRAWLGCVAELCIAMLGFDCESWPGLAWLGWVLRLAWHGSAVCRSSALLVLGYKFCQWSGFGWATDPEEISVNYVRSALSLG